MHAVVVFLLQSAHVFWIDNILYCSVPLIFCFRIPMCFSLCSCVMASELGEEEEEEEEEDVEGGRGRAVL